jgi:hypothetical protein
MIVPCSGEQTGAFYVDLAPKIASKFAKLGNLEGLPVQHKGTIRISTSDQFDDSEYCPGRPRVPSRASPFPPALAK